MTIIKQAENFERVKVLKYKDTDQPVDLSGCTAYSQMRVTPGGDLIATAECSVSPVEGRVTAAFSSEQTADIEPGTYGFDIWLKCEDVLKPIHTEEIKIVKRYTENFEIGEVGEVDDGA